MVKRNKTISEVVSISDEAYALLIAQSRDLNSWIAKLTPLVKAKKRKSKDKEVIDAVEDAPSDELLQAQEDGDDDKEEASSNKDTAEETKNRELERKKYYKLFLDIKTKRATEDEGTSWDEGFKEAIRAREARGDDSFRNSTSSLSTKGSLNDDDGEEVVECEDL